MCTAVAYKSSNFYFGRTLDYDISFNEQVAITPRSYNFDFEADENKGGYAIIGMACVKDNYPLYYDAMNEKGLCIAGLNFVGNAVYGKEEMNRLNVSQYQFVPYILQKCADVCEAKTLLKNMNITDKPFCTDLPVAQLHWLIADKNDCITVETVDGGLEVYQNPVGVLTNNPPFKEQLSMLNRYANLSPYSLQKREWGDFSLNIDSRGLGAVGLPGDVSSSSRFARAVFTKLNSVCNDKSEEVSQFFHILDIVKQIRGCCRLEENKHEITMYSSCMNSEDGIYYYTTYGNRRISAVNMKKENLLGDNLVLYPISKQEDILTLN